MAQAIRRKGTESEPFGINMGQRLREGVLILTGGLGLVLLFALWSHHPSDPGWSHTGSGGEVHNLAGIVGAWVADILLYLCGRFAYIFPLMICFAGWLAFRESRAEHPVDYFFIGIRAVGFLLTLVPGCGLLWAHGRGAGLNGLEPPGGVIGDVAGNAAVAVFGGMGGVLLLLALFLTGLTLFTGLSWLALMDRLGAWTLALWALLLERCEVLRDELQGWRARREREAVFMEDAVRHEGRPPPRIEPKISAVEPSDREDRERQRAMFEAPADAALPPLSLLQGPRAGGPAYSTEALEAMSRLVELKLRDFGIEVQVVAVHPGPVITRFELLPAPGIKASRISGLAKDLARSLSLVSVRVVEVIPGKSVVGLEIPNQERETVMLSEILKSREYEQSGSHLTLALGKDIAGLPVVVDLARMPHLLVAGTTGSGKSVALNAMILSLLYKSTPADVRLIMIDPKMLELSVYERIPALLAPVVTDMKEAANALRWSVAEMERRYRLMAALGVRNLAGYNRKILDAEERGEPLRDPLWRADPLLGEDLEAPLLGRLPQIVVIVDELADMMMVVGKKVEELIARLAQKARASGIHLILATQRPSVDVITGLIKANIPSRIAFQVSSRVDSRTILDQMGAETLLGHGDMLYLPPGTALPTRVHGAFVSDEEVHAVVAQLRSAGEPEYLEDVVSGVAEGADAPIPGLEPEAGGEVDPLYDEAVRIVTESRRASISGVQRRLKIGYNRAARMMEDMERAGVVGELQSNGMREVLAPPPPRD